MKKTFVLLAMGVLLGMPVGARGQVTLVIDPAIDQSKVDFDLWNRIIVPVHDRLTHPFTSRALHIYWRNFTAGGCSAIYIRTYPREKSDLNDTFYRTITHEYGHSKFECRRSTDFSAFRNGAFDLMQEGLAEAEKHLTYRELARTVPGIVAETDLFRETVLDNLPINALAGYRTYNDNDDMLQYNAIAAKFEVLVNKLPGKNFNAYYRALDEVRPQNTREHLAMLDTLVGAEKIDGVSTSTFFLQSPESFLNGPDGTFFGVFSGSNTWHQSPAPISGRRLAIFIAIRARQDGLQKLPAALTFQWTIKDVFGKTAASGSTYGSDIINASGFPEGAYRLNVCVLKSDGACDADRQDTSYFVVYNHAWETGKIFIVANAPEYAELNSNMVLRLVNAPAGVYTETYPGLLVVNLNGSTQDIVVSNGQKTRIFTPDWEVSRFVFFTDRDQPYLYRAVNSASFAPGALVPGSITTLWTWGAAHTDPEQPQTLPLPTASCRGPQGNTRVVFSANGRTFESPFFYCSQGQLNVQVPWGLGGSNTVVVHVALNNTRSNALTMPLAEADPGIFVVDWPNKTGAVTFQDGQIADDAHPAEAGVMLSIYATGLGAVDPAPLGNGLAAPISPLSVTLNAPVVLIDGMPCPVSFSGLASGFVGLYQINFTVPEGLTGGTHELVLSIRDSISNTVKLFTR